MPIRPSALRAGLPLLGALVAAIALLALPSHARAQAPVSDIGFKDQSYGSIGGSITGSKPESKLWFNDGIWWADMYSTTTGTHRIFRLNRATNTWSDAGTTLDTRATTRSDILWDQASGKLYVASHSYTSQSTTSATTGTDGKLWRYSYNAAADSYTLDTGFPVAVGSPSKTETLVIDRDSTGRLWATWTADRAVWVNHTDGTDTSWGTPYVVPGSPTLDVDDISSLISFSGHIGVMWSQQNKTTTPETGSMWFAVHGDGTGDTAASWSTSAIPTGWSPDDHINLKNDGNGNIYAAVKTSESTGANPLILMLKRTLTNATTGAGTWSTTVYGRVSDSHTRPVLLLDPTDNQVHMFATCPQPPSKSGQSGGNICEKVSSMSNPSFPTGIGTAVMQDHTSQDMNDSTTTKQNVSPATGLVVMANDKTTQLYWHTDEPLGGGGPPPSGPTADFTATPTSGTAPLVVQFTSTSTGSPTSFSYNFGDGTPAGTTANPTHTYANPGTYTVALTVSNANGSDTKTQTGLITVGSQPQPGGTSTFNAVADAPVKSTSANNNYGTDTQLRVRQGTSATDTFYHSYVKFDVSGLSGTPTGAKLRLFVTDASPDGGRVFPVANTWSESTVTWANAPAIGAQSIGAAGTTTAGGYVEIPLPASAVTGNGTYSFALTSTSSNSAYYSSREGANPPQLVVSTDGGGGGTPDPLVADFSGSPTSGTAPLGTTFTDLSTGGADGWTWDFGDGTAVSHAQNPAHTYTTAGTYTVTLTDTRSSDGATATKTRTGYITVGTTPPPPSGTLTFTPIADAHVKNTSPTSNYGTATTLQLRQGDASNTTTYVTYLKFAVSGVNGAPVTSAKLRLYVTDASPDGGSVFRVDDTWTETGLTWNTRPALPATSIGTAGSVVAGGYVDIDLGSAITGDGTYALALSTSSTNSAIFGSRESATKPQLVLGV